jgi:hypothetical protein
MTGRAKPPKGRASTPDWEIWVRLLLAMSTDTLRA